MRSDVHGTSNVVSTRTGRSNRSDRVSAIERADHVQGRAADECRQDRDIDRVGADGDAVHDAEVDHGQDGDLRVGDGREHRADIPLRWPGVDHHVAAGSLCRTAVNSPHNQRNGSP